MSFYVIEIADGADSIKGKAIYEYAAQKEAVAVFHQKLGNAMRSELYTSALLMVIDGNGQLLKREKYTA